MMDQMNICVVRIARGRVHGVTGVQGGARGGGREGVYLV